MADLLTHAQIALLADLLRTDPSSLASLEHLGAEGVHALRSRISDLLFDSLAPVFARVSKLAPLVPNAVVVSLAHKALPPEVAGRAAGALGLAHEDRAVGVLSAMKPSYLADAARYVDPRVIPHFAPKLPARLLVPTAKELLRRGDYLTASRFVEFATDQLIVDFEKAIDDDEGILRTGALVWRADVLNEILRVAGPTRMTRMTATAATGSQALVIAALSVLCRVDPAHAAPGIEQLLGHPDPDVVSRILGIAAQDDALAEVLDLSAVLSDDGIDRLASAPILGDPAFVEQIALAADTAQRRKSLKRIQATVAAPTRTAKTR